MQVLSMSVVLICSILDSCVGAPMVVFRSWPAAMDFCCAAGARDLDVILTFDTRPFDALDYVQPLSSLKEAWAGMPKRVYVELHGVDSIAIDLRSESHWWEKVRLMLELLAWPRVRFAAWADSDATICPSVPIDTNPKTRYLATRLHFPSLSDIFERRAIGCDRVVFVGYRERLVKKVTCFGKPCGCRAVYPTRRLNGHYLFNAGVFVAKGDASLALFRHWWRLRPPAGWEPRGKVGCVRGYEQYRYDRHMATLLTAQHLFCEQQARSSVAPFVHFYGRGQFYGKSQVFRWCSSLHRDMSMSQRGHAPGFHAYVLRKRPASGAKHAMQQCRGRRKNSVAIREAMGHPVRFGGKRYPSLRAAAESAGVSRSKMRRLAKKVA